MTALRAGRVGVLPSWGNMLLGKRREEGNMAQCEVCGNDYDKAFSGLGTYSPTLTVALTR